MTGTPFFVLLFSIGVPTLAAMPQDLKIIGGRSRIGFIRFKAPISLTENRYYHIFERRLSQTLNPLLESSEGRFIKLEGSLQEEQKVIKEERTRLKRQLDQFYQRIAAGINVGEGLSFPLDPVGSRRVSVVMGRQRQRLSLARALFAWKRGDHVEASRFIREAQRVFPHQTLPTAELSGNESAISSLIQEGGKIPDCCFLQLPGLPKGAIMSFNGEVLPDNLERMEICQPSHLEVSASGYLTYSNRIDCSHGNPELPNLRKGRNLLTPVMTDLFQIADVHELDTLLVATSVRERLGVHIFSLGFPVEDVGYSYLFANNTGVTGMGSEEGGSGLIQEILRILLRQGKLTGLFGAGRASPTPLQEEAWYNSDWFLGGMGIAVLGGIFASQFLRSEEEIKFGTITVHIEGEGP